MKKCKRNQDLAETGDIGVRRKTNETYSLEQSPRNLEKVRMKRNCEGVEKQLTWVFRMAGNNFVDLYFFNCFIKQAPLKVTPCGNFFFKNTL